MGLPLGNLTSQILANRYLDAVDHLSKINSERPYLRYMVLSTHGGTAGSRAYPFA
ncbi:MAG: hypothetical protein IPK82_22675 [Polyangiaceae bacterium]|nr:hypothetical protein [Polyangiaceae bacterium]